ncbi:hypothetical protein HNY73_014334 [Argiope bruennichi]|uniref:Uncharacterized protein n=1 Tax=Argiope bruennichi TaxID=94029 RepID=A0A8T0ENY3_ARGBR|nr:hypothetical protein HNY73_014334 [Argiope bruennichi]
MELQLETEGSKRFAAVQKAEKKLWQEVPQASSQDAKLDGGGFASAADYTNRDMGGYSAGTDYQNGGMGNYGNNYDGNMNGNGYNGGGGYSGGGGYNSVSYSESYSGPSESYSGSQDGFSNSGDGYSGHSDSFSGGHGDGFGGDLRNGGWDKPVKTVVKHTIKNIAVPHPVPAPVSVPVPRYVKYFKPFAIAKPFGVPHVIPVIKHIQKPIPFFTALPIQQAVPVPKFVGLPVQVRVPKPVFIHVPKIVPVAKRVPVPVEVNIPKPYIVPIYKHVPVPVPHRVPKVINIIKEVPHYVKKPVPVYVDENGSIDYGGGGTSYSSSYNNNYGNDYQGGYGNGDNSYGGQHTQQGNSYNNFDMGYNNNGGNDYNQYQNYGNSQESNQYNSPYLKGQNHNSQKIYPANSYPRAHRLPNKSQPTTMKASEYSQIDGSNANNNQGSGYELSVEVKHNGATNNNPNFNKNVQASNQLQTAPMSDNYYQNANNQNKPFNNLGSTGHSSASFDSLASAQNVASGYSQPFSQPVFNPSSYADYAANQAKNNENYQQNNSQIQYSQQSFSETPTTQPAAANTGMLTEASKSFSNYQQYNPNSYGNGYSENQQSNNYNSIPYGNQFSNYNNAKSPYPSKQNFEFTSFFKQPVPYQQTQTSIWDSNTNFNNNKYASPEQQNQQLSYPQQSPKNNFGYNKDLSEFGNNPIKNNYNNFQNGYQSSNYQAGNNQNNNYNAYDNYPQSGATFSSNSYSNSYSQPSNVFQNDKNNMNAYKDNEKYDQSPSQNSYSSAANNAVPGLYSPAGTSYSSSSAYSNEYVGNQGFPTQETKQVTSSLAVNNAPDTQHTLKTDSMNPSYGYSNFQEYSQNPLNGFQTTHGNGGISTQTFSMNHPTSYSNNYPSQFSNPSYAGQENKQGLGLNMDNTGLLGYHNSAQFSSQENNPGMSNSNEASVHANYHDSLGSSPQDNKQGFSHSDISGVKSSENGGNQMLQDSFASLIASASTNKNTYSQPASPASTYTSNSYSNNNPYTMPSTSNYQSDLFNSNSQLYTGNTSQNVAYNNNQPIITAADISNSYGYSQQVNEPSPAYTAVTTYSNPYPTTEEKYSQFSQPQMSQFLLQNPLQTSSSGQKTGTNQESSVFNQKTDSQGSSSSTSKAFQGFGTKLDEMEQHMDSMHSSGSSIINVYTNSPDSKEAKKGHTFTFIDPISLESSHASKYYTPPDPASDKKSKYSNSDLQIVQAPSFKSDPNEPLQTSLDAYVPAQPVYYPPSSDQNTVYKEAMPVADTVYKEAVSLDSNSKEKTR